MANQIIQTNIVSCDPDWQWITDLNGWTGYHLWHVTGGHVTVETSHATYQLSPGDCFFFDLSINHLCTHRPEDPLHVEAIYWHNADTITPYAYHVKNNTALCTAIHQCVIHFAKENGDAAGKWLDAAICEFLLLSEENTSAGNRSIAVLCEWIQKHCEDKMNLDLLSSKAGYSKNQLIRLIRQETGLTPHQYVTQCRISKSISLLAYTNHQITDIAQLCGFDDLAHYSSTFKKSTGRSPSQFRTHGHSSTNIANDKPINSNILEQ